MMLVNASYQQGVFYTQTITGLCPGTTYEFAAWIQNILNYVANKPNVTFRVEGTDGTLLAPPVNTGNIQEFTGWVQYALQFTTPQSATSVVIKLINNGPGGAGNDLVLDDITFRACGPVLTTSVNGNAPDSNFNLCVGDNTTINLTANYSGGYNVPDFQWQVNNGSGWTDIPGATGLAVSQQFIAAKEGVYQYRLAAGEDAIFSSVQCRVYSAGSTVTVNPYPVATASNTGPYCPGNDVALTASGGDSYTWNGPNGYSSNEQSPVIKNASQQNSGLYNVIVSKNGCQSTASTSVQIVNQVLPVVSANVSICRGSSTVLQASGGNSYHWLPNASLSNTDISSPTATPDSTTTYYVQISNGYCLQTDSVKVTVLQPAQANAGEGATLIAGQSFKLNGTEKGSAVNYYWKPADYLSNPNILDPIATPPKDITYTLYVVSAYCNTATADVTIKVQPKLVIPNTFTPNGDGVNDLWLIDGLNYYSSSLVQVFNRYGTKVYESRGYMSPWNGKYNGENLPTGTYYYVINLNNGQPGLSGWVLIVR